MISRGMSAYAWSCLLVLALVACPAPEAASVPTAPTLPVAAPAPHTPERIVSEIRRQARSLSSMVQSPWVRDFLLATSALPEISTRVIYSDGAGAFYPSLEAAPLVARPGLRRVEVDEESYYYGKLGTPLSYARPLDLLARAGVDHIAGLRVLDFGYGTVGAPRLLASLGADVTGVDVNAERHAVYSAPSDQGEIRGPTGQTGHLRLLLGRWPAEPALVAAVGTGYDIILAKNVLKNGYVHPAKLPPDGRRRFQLGVSDEEFVQQLARILRPGGRVIVYNLAPAQAPPDAPYRPHADGRCPFPEGLWRGAGLLLRPPGMDQDDTVFARLMGRTLEWHLPDPRHVEDPPMDLENDLFASYSLFEKAQKPL